jgi:threonine 3-dehydrogenase
MPALVKREPGPGLSLDEVPVPKPAYNEALIRVLKTGVCGTDGHIFGWDQWAAHRIKPPLVVGHEFMGRVEAIGESVRNFKPGDRVSGEGHIGCGCCYFCRTGQGHICRRVEIIGVDRNGCFASYLTMPETNLWRLHPSIPDDVGGVLDPFGNAMHTVMAQPIAGRTVAVVGAGAIGLMACRIAEAAGALNIYALEPQRHKRELALTLGVSKAYDPAANGWKQDLLAETMEGLGVDVVLEMSGHPEGIRNAFEIVRPGGDVALLGIPSKEVSLDLSDLIIFKSVTVRGINGRKMFETWYECERFLVDHKIDLLPIITHRYHYKDYLEAFEVLRRGEALKVVLDWSDGNA